MVEPTDLVWNESLPQWIPAGTVPNLLPSRVASSPPPPPPSAISQAPAPPAFQSSATEPGRIRASFPPKDPILMAVLSFFIPWLGQILIGQVKKGIVMIIATPILLGVFVALTCGVGLIALPFVEVLAVVDAYLLAKKLKEGGAIGEWEFFGIESAPTLSAASLSAADRPAGAAGAGPRWTMKPRPPGLVGSAIGILCVSGLAMMLTLLGVIAILMGDAPVLSQICIALSFIHNAWVIFAVYQAIRMERYSFAITAPLLVLGSWLWLAFSGIPIGLSVLGILGGISVGLWSLSVLRQPEVRAAFANQYDPLETLLPMAQASIQSSSPQLAALKGLLQQLMTNKIALGALAGALFLLLLVPLVALFLPSQDKSKFLGASPASYYGDKSDWGAPDHKRHSRTGSSTDSTDDGDDSPGTNGPAVSGTEDYKDGYQTGLETGRQKVDLYRGMPAAAKVEFHKKFNEMADEFDSNYEDALRSYGPKNGSVQRLHGIADGYRKALEDGGISP